MAVAVEDQEAERARIEAEVRNTILRDAVQANVMPDVTEEAHVDKDRRKLMLVCATVSLLFLLVVALGLGYGLSKKDAGHGPRDIYRQQDYP